MSNPKRVLILTADAGFGHRSAANAVAAALEERWGHACQVDILNPMEDKRTPFFLRDSGSDYDKIVRNVPELYKFSYDASDSAVPTALVETGLTVLLYEVLRDAVRAYRPDAILSTYPLYQAPLAAVFTVSRLYIPLLTVVTDLVTVHRLWFHRNVDACLVPNELVADLAISNGVSPKKLAITGLPVHPNIAREKRSKAEIRAALGWQTEPTTILAVGSRRGDNLLSALNVLNHFGMPLQLAVAAGKDEKLYQALNEIQWHQPWVHLYEYSTEIPAMMHASDAIICKAGGLVVTEALACGLPLMLVDVIPGQEEGNAQYVISGGAADLVTAPLEALELMAHWMGNEQALLHERAANACLLGRPDAAYVVSDLVYQAAQRGPVNMRGKRIAGRPNLLDVLNRNHVHWRERLLLTNRDQVGEE